MRVKRNKILIFFSFFICSEYSVEDEESITKKNPIRAQQPCLVDIVNPKLNHREREIHGYLDHYGGRVPVFIGAGGTYVLKQGESSQDNFVLRCRRNRNNAKDNDDEKMCRARIIRLANDATRKMITDSIERL